HGLRSTFVREQARRRSLLPRGDRAARLGTQVSAMGGYLNLFDPWLPTRLDSPTLFVRATEGFAGLPPYPAEQQFPLDLCDALVTVPGNHFTVISQHADSCARVMHDWLAEVL